MAALLVDEVIASLDETWAKVPFGGDDIAAKRAAWLADARAKYLPYFEARLGAGPFFTGTDLSLADLFVFVLTDMMSSNFFDHIDGATSLDGFAALQAHRAAVAAHPLVVAHGK